MGKPQLISQIVLLFPALVLFGWAQLAHADGMDDPDDVPHADDMAHANDIAAPSSPQPILGAPVDRFTPTDVAAAPPPSGLLSPAPPSFQRLPCQAGTCGGSVARRGGIGLSEQMPQDGAPPGQLRLSP